MFYVTNPSIIGTLKTRMKVANSTFWQPFIEDGAAPGKFKMNGYGVARTKQVNTGYIFFGDFSQGFLAEWGVLDIKVDPYTLGDENMIVVRGFQFIDFGVRQPGAFALIDNFS